MNWSLVGALLLVLFGFLAGALAVWKPNDSSTFIIAAGGYVFVGLKWLYNNQEKVFMFIQKLKCTFLGLDTNWDLTATFELSSEFDYVSLEKKFLKLPNSNKKIIKNQDGVVDLSYDGYRFQIIPEYDRVEIYVFNISVSYKRAEDILSKKLGPILDLIQSDLKIERATFFLKMKFLGSNPFLGFYLKRITTQDIKRFDIAFVIQSDEITISQNEIKIKAQTIPELVSLSKRMLALSPGD